jgi:hypothetical protein
MLPNDRRGSKPEVTSIARYVRSAEAIEVRLGPLPNSYIAATLELNYSIGSSAGAATSFGAGTELRLSGAVCWGR